MMNFAGEETILNAENDALIENGSPSHRVSRMGNPVLEEGKTLFSEKARTSDCTHSVTSTIINNSSIEQDSKSDIKMHNDQGDESGEIQEHHIVGTKNEQSPTEVEVDGSIVPKEVFTSIALGGLTDRSFQRKLSSAETECASNLKKVDIDLSVGNVSETKNSLNSHTSGTTTVSKQSTQDSFMGKSTKSMGIWSRFLNKSEVWMHQDIDIDENDKGFFSRTLIVCQKGFWSIKTTLYTALHNPLIIIVSFLIFAIILIAGLVAVQALAKIYVNERKNQAEDLAYHSSAAFSKALNDAGRGPLFAISQFVKHLDSFKDLPHEIGQRDDFGLVPDHLAPALAGKELTHRDLSNTSATSEGLLNLFNDIAANAKKDAGLEGVLVSLQLAPMGVVSMIYPLINTEDFEPPLYMNNTGALGHDLLYDERRVAAARKTLSSDSPVVVGPLTLIQNNAPVVKDAFIMRLAINMTGYLIEVPQDDGTVLDYESWGFAVVLLNWAKAKEKTGLYKEFEDKNMQFSLTRVDTKIDPITEEVEQTIVQIANSSRWYSLNDENSVKVTLDTTNNMWTMTVGYEDGMWPEWHRWMKVLVFLIAFSIGIMIMIVLVVRKQYQNLLHSMLPPTIVKRLRKGETIVQMYDKPTIYFSDIVGYTSMSETMTPMEVMAMLNEMYTEFDKLVRKHGVYKVETIGDAYMVIGGGPDGNSSVEGAKRVALFALDVLNFVKDYRTKQGLEIHLRCGLASGPVVGAVVGITMPKFSIFGDTVNFASRMESTSKPMRIQCNGLTYNMLRESRDLNFHCVERTEDCSEDGIFVKGKGFVKTWWVNNATESEDS